MHKPEYWCREIPAASTSPGVGLLAIELPIRGERLAQRSDTRQRPLAARVPRNVECTFADDMNLDLVPLLQLQRRDNRGGKTNGKAVAPFRDLHAILLGYTF